MCKLTSKITKNILYRGMRWRLCPRGRGVLSVGGGCGVDWGAPEPPPARPRTAGPPPGWAFDRAQPHRTESLRRPPIIAASSRWVSARPVHPQSRGPPSPPHRDGLPPRSCGSEPSRFSPTAPRVDNKEVHGRRFRPFRGESSILRIGAFGALILNF